MPKKNQKDPANYPLRLSQPRHADLARYPYGLWMDAVLTEVFPGFNWETKGKMLIGNVGTGITFCLYAVSQTEVRIDLAPDLDSEPSHSYQFVPANFSAATFTRWFRTVVEHVEAAIRKIERSVAGTVWEEESTALATAWPQATTSSLNFPIAVSRRGIRRRASRVYEDPISMSRDLSLWPLCGLCVVVGTSAEANTRTAALLAAADQAAVKSRSVYVFRSATAPSVFSAVGAMRDRVADRLFLVPDGGNDAEFLEGTLHKDAQTVIVDLGAVLTANPTGGDGWQIQGQLMSRDPTNYVLFLTAPETVSPTQAADLIQGSLPKVSRIYWMESAGRLCALYGQNPDGVFKGSVPGGVIFPPFP